MVILPLIIGFIIRTFVIALRFGVTAIYLGGPTVGFGLDPHAAASTSMVTVLSVLELGAFSYWS